MFRVNDTNDNHGDGTNGDSPIRIQINSGSNSVNDNSSNYHPGPYRPMAPAQSIFSRGHTGYVLSTANFKPPAFNNDPYKYGDFKNKLHHYLLMLGIYSAVNDAEISETSDMDLYLAITSCLSEKSLDLVSSQAFGRGQKAYNLLDQKYLGNADAREAKAMIDITNISQSDNEDLISYLDRFEVLKSRLDAFNTINKCSFYSILCIRGLHHKYSTFKDIITTGKTPSWETFRERVQSHAAMMTLDRQKSGKVLNVTNYAPKIVKRGGRNFKKFVDTNSRKCLNCFGRNHTTKNCHSQKWCTNCSNASHNTTDCRLKHKFTVQANLGSQYPPAQPRSGFTPNQRQTQPRGRGNRPHFATNRGGRGRFSKPKQPSVNTVTASSTSNDLNDYANEYENEYENNINIESHFNDNDIYNGTDNTDGNAPSGYNTNGNMFI